MAIMGLRHTENFVDGERPKNWRAGILLKYPNGMTPLTGLTAAMKDRTTDDPEFYWWEKPLENRRLQLTASLGAVAANTAATISVVDRANTVKRGDMFYVEHTGEIMWVSADPVSLTEVPVLRGYAGSTAGVVTLGTHNPKLKIIGSSYEESSAAPTGINFDPSKLFNYTQIFRNTLEMSNTARNTKLRTKEQVLEAKREVSEFHAIDMEMAFWFGRRSYNTIGGKPARTTDGIFATIPVANVRNQNGAPLDMNTIEGWMLEVFKNGSNEKMAFCGNRALLAINQAVRKNSTWNIASGIKEYGMRVTRIITPFGELVVKTHPLWNQMSSDPTGAPAYYSLDSYLCILDMANIKYVILQGRDTKYEDDLQDNGLDGMKAGWITECGLEIGYRETMHLFKGLNSGAKDA